MSTFGVVLAGLLMIAVIALPFFAMWGDERDE